MVKPVYPHHRLPGSARFNHEESDDESGEVEGAVGYTTNTFSVHEDDVFASDFENQDIVRTRHNIHLSTSLSRANKDSPYANELQDVTTPTPAPRERISSVPVEDLNMHSSLPVLRQRRSSAPAETSVKSNPTCGNPSDLPPALRDIATKGQELFWFILSEEIKSREAEDPVGLSAFTIPASSQRMEILGERGQCGGRTLRQIAEAFAHSSQRLRVREHAEQIDHRSLTYDSFSDLLFGLFQDGGVTQARVLVLFFFCSDVALLALKERLTYRFQQLVDWTSRYITERLSAWVFDNGGWAAVLQESVDQAVKVTFFGVCCIGIIVCSVFIWQHFKH